MFHCDHCGTDLVDGTCPDGHPASDPNVVVPAGATTGAVVQPDGSAKVISLGRSQRAASSSMTEALRALEDAAEHTPERTPELPADEPVMEAPAPEPAPEDPTPAQPSFEEVSFAWELGAVEEPSDEPASDDPHQPDASVVPSSDASAASLSIGGDLIGKPVRAAGGRREVSKKLLVIPLVLAVLGGAGVFFVFGSSGTAEAAVYRRVFTPKESHTYRFSMSMAGSVEAGPVNEQMNVSMNMTMTERTLAVDADGVATIEQAIDGAEMSVNGERVPIPELGGISIAVRMAPDGRVLDVDGLGAFSLGDTGPIGELMGPNTMGPLLPSDKVAPGDEWTVAQDVPNPLVDGSMKMTARNRLVERRMDGGVETALIRSELDMPMNMKISMRKLLELAEDSLGGSLPDAGIPKKAVFVYEGGMTMKLLQTIEVATSRPTRITGDGDADIRMKIEGIPGGMPEMRMRMRMKMSMVEIEPATRTAASSFAPDPVLSA